MALSCCAGICYDRDLFLTLHSNITHSRGAIMLKIQNIKLVYMSEVWLCRGHLLFVRRVDEDHSSHLGVVVAGSDECADG